MCSVWNALIVVPMDREGLEEDDARQLLQAGNRCIAGHTAFKTEAISGVVRLIWRRMCALQELSCSPRQLEAHHSVPEPGQGQRGAGNWKQAIQMESCHALSAWIGATCTRNADVSAQQVRYSKLSFLFGCLISTCYVFSYLETGGSDVVRME